MFDYINTNEYLYLYLILFFIFNFTIYLLISILNYKFCDMRSLFSSSLYFFFLIFILNCFDSLSVLESDSQSDSGKDKEENNRDLPPLSADILACVLVILYIIYFNHFSDEGAYLSTLFWAIRKALDSWNK